MSDSRIGQTTLCGRDMTLGVEDDGFGVVDDDGMLDGIGVDGGDRESPFQNKNLDDFFFLLGTDGVEEGVGDGDRDASGGEALDDTVVAGGIAAFSSLLILDRASWH
jgi:hypothetical protein